MIFDAGGFPRYWILFFLQRIIWGFDRKDAGALHPPVFYLGLG